MRLAARTGAEARLPGVAAAFVALTAERAPQTRQAAGQRQRPPRAPASTR